MTASVIQAVEAEEKTHFGYESFFVENGQANIETGFF